MNINFCVVSVRNLHTIIWWQCRHRRSKWIWIKFKIYAGWSFILHILDNRWYSLIFIVRRHARVHATTAIKSKLKIMFVIEFYNNAFDWALDWASSLFQSFSCTDMWFIESIMTFKCLNSYSRMMLYSFISSAINNQLNAFWTKKNEII